MDLRGGFIVLCVSMVDVRMVVGVLIWCIFMLSLVFFCFLSILFMMCVRLFSVRYCLVISLCLCVILMVLSD